MPVFRTWTLASQKDQFPIYHFVSESSPVLVKKKKKKMMMMKKKKTKKKMKKKKKKKMMKKKKKMMKKKKYHPAENQVGPPVLAAPLLFASLAHGVWECSQTA